MLANTQGNKYRLDVCHAINDAVLIYTEHIRNFVRSSVWKFIDFSNTLNGRRYIIFHFTVTWGWTPCKALKVQYLQHS